MSVVSHLSLEEWNSTAIADYHMFPGHIHRINELLKHYCHSDICDDVELAPELVTSFSDIPRLKDKELRVIASLHDGLHLARTFHSIVVTFIVLDENDPGRIVFEFDWDCPPIWTAHFGIPTRFSCRISADGMYVLLVGPTERNHLSRAIPTTKLLMCKTWTVKTLELLNSEAFSRLWPANMEFDPRPGYSHLVTMIGTSVGRHNVSPCSLCGGLLMQYNAKSGHYRFSDGTPISSALLKYTKEGQQLLALHDQESWTEHVVYLYNSDTLEMLQRIDVSSVRTSSYWPWACIHIVPVASACYRYLSFILWSFERSDPTSPNTDVITVELPYIGDHVFSLQQACRMTIRCHLEMDAVHKLPLPKKLKDFINGNTQGSELGL